MTKLARNHHQNSLRLARPWNIAYFLKNRANACPKLAPRSGASSGAWPAVVSVTATPSSTDAAGDGPRAQGHDGATRLEQACAAPERGIAHPGWRLHGAPISANVRPSATT